MNGTIPKIVITGGPCAGKTSVINLLKDEYGDRIITVPEAATLLLAGGFPKPGEHLEWSEGWQYAFQRSVLNLTRSLEEAYAIMAAKKGAKLLVCDNGLPSGAAYMPAGVPQFVSMYNLDLLSELSSYDAVVHLETIAIANPEKYGRHNNESRYTSMLDAIRHDAVIKEIWECHPRRLILASELPLEEKYHGVKGVVEEILERENF